MEYFVILIASYNDGTADKKAIYEYDNENDAIANYHSYLGSYMKDNKVEHVCVVAMNNNGGIYETGVFDRGGE